MSKNPFLNTEEVTAHLPGVYVEDPELPQGRSAAPLQHYVTVPGTAYGHRGEGDIGATIYPNMRTVSSVLPAPDPSSSSMGSGGISSCSLAGEGWTGGSCQLCRVVQIPVPQRRPGRWVKGWLWDSPYHRVPTVLREVLKWKLVPDWSGKTCFRGGDISSSESPKKENTYSGSVGSTNGSTGRKLWLSNKMGDRLLPQAASPDGVSHPPSGLWVRSRRSRIGRSPPLALGIGNIRTKIPCP